MGHPCEVQIESIWPSNRPNRPNLELFSRKQPKSTDLGQIWLKFDQIDPKSTNLTSNLTNSTKTPQQVTCLGAFFREFRQIRRQIGRFGVDLGPNSTKFGRFGDLSSRRPFGPFKFPLGVQMAQIESIRTKSPVFLLFFGNTYAFLLNLCSIWR